MFGFELEIFLQKHINEAIYILSIDKLPKKKIKLPSYYVINLSPSYYSDGHWVGVAFLYNTAFYFDSLNLPMPLEIEAFLKNGASKMVQNNFRVQQLTSPVCGQHTVVFLIHMFQRHSFESFCQQFSTFNYFLNDHITLTRYNALK